MKLKVQKILIVLGSKTNYDILKQLHVNQKRTDQVKSDLTAMPLNRRLNQLSAVGLIIRDFPKRGYATNQITKLGRRYLDIIYSLPTGDGK